MRAVILFAAILALAQVHAAAAQCDAQKVGACSQEYATCAQGASTDFGKQCDCGKTVISCIKDAGCPIPDGQCSAFSQLPGCEIAGCSGGSAPAQPTTAPPSGGSSGSCDASKIATCGQTAQTCVTGAGTDFGKICDCYKETLSCIKGAGCPVPDGTCQALSQIPNCNIEGCSGGSAPAQPTTAPPAASCNAADVRSSQCTQVFGQCVAAVGGNSAPAQPTSAPPSGGTGSCDAQKVGTCSQAYSTCAQGASTDLGKQCDCAKEVIKCIKDAGCPIPDTQCSGFSQLPGCDIPGCGSSGGSSPAQPTTAPPSGGSSGSCDASKIATCGQNAQTCVTGAGTDFGKICDCYKETLSCIKGAGCPVPDGTCQALSQIPNCQVEGCTRRLLEIAEPITISEALTPVVKHESAPAGVVHVSKIPTAVILQANCDAAKAAPCAQDAQTCMTGAGSDFGKICDCAKTLVSCVEGAGCPIPSDQCAGFEQLPGCTISGCSGAPSGPAPSTAPPASGGTGSCDAQKVGTCSQTYATCAQGASTDLGKQCDCAKEVIKCIKDSGCPIPSGQCSGFSQLPGCSIEGCDGGSAPAQPTSAPAPAPTSAPSSGCAAGYGACLATLNTCIKAKFPSCDASAQCMAIGGAAVGRCSSTEVRAACAGSAPSGSTNKCSKIFTDAKADGCDLSGLPFDYLGGARSSVMSWLRSGADSWITNKRADFCSKGCGEKIAKGFDCLRSNGLSIRVQNSAAGLARLVCKKEGDDVCISTYKRLRTMPSSAVNSGTATQESVAAVCTACTDMVIKEMSRHSDTAREAMGLSSFCLKDNGKFCWPTVQSITGSNMQSFNPMTASKETLDTICKDRCFFRTISRAMEMSPGSSRDNFSKYFSIMCVRNGDKYCFSEISRLTQDLTCLDGSSAPSTPSGPSTGSCDAQKVASCSQTYSTCAQGASTDLGKQCDCAKEVIKCIKDSGCPVPSGQCSGFSQLPGCTIDGCDGGSAPAQPTSAPPSGGTGSCDAQKVGTCSQAYSTCAQGASTDLGKQCDCAKEVIKCIKDAGCPIPNGQCSGFSQLPGCDIPGCGSSGGSSPAQPTTAPSGGSSGSCDATKIATCGQNAQTCVTGAGTDFGKICDCYKETLSCIKGAGCPVPDGTCQALSQIPNCQVDGCTRLLEIAPENIHGLETAANAAIVAAGKFIEGHKQKASIIPETSRAATVSELLVKDSVVAQAQAGLNAHLTVSKVRNHALTIAQANCDAAKAAPCAQDAQTCMTGAGSDFGKICDCAKTLVSCVEGAGCPIPSDQCAGFEQLPGCTISGCSGAPSGPAPSTAPPASGGTGSCDTQKIGTCSQTYATCAQGASTDLGKQCDCAKEVIKCIKDSGCPIPSGQCSGFSQLPGCSIEGCDGGSAPAQPSGTTAPSMGACSASCIDEVKKATGPLGCCIPTYIKIMSAELGASQVARLGTCGFDTTGDICPAAQPRKIRRAARLRMQWTWVQANLAKFKSDFKADVAGSLGVSVDAVVIIEVKQVGTRLLQDSGTSEVEVDYEVTGTAQNADSVANTDVTLFETSQSYEASTGNTLEVEGQSGSGGDGGGGGLYGGAIAGIIIGVLVVLGIIGAVVFVVMKKGDDSGSSSKTSLPAGGNGGVVGATSQPAASGNTAQV